ncbi:hypothetical protein [Cohnella terricola]|uniref:Uncharacterized protein n=1 Tax=Cohnella terricola TaxID=1289167 RepID=A0A559J8W5_9BACL|nr:hypothetical protein [Cohnella terricola]TVX96312.1 hypothetical protein FPZ45_21650 [Cohnella terricola]
MYNQRFPLIIVIILLLVSGCTGNQSDDSAPSAQSSQPSLGAGNLVEQAEVPSDKFMMDLRETLNLSFKILQAMDGKDYTFLESVTASGVTIDKENNQVIYNFSGEEMKYDFLTGINLNNLEYWGSGYIESSSRFQIVLAKFLNDTHGTIYFDFIKESNQWLFNGITTNA